MKKHTASLLALAVSATALQGCMEQPPPPAVSHRPIYYEDTMGKAAVCTVSDVKVVDGKETPVTMNTGGGGWCAISVRHIDSPYATGLLTQPPHAGKVFVHAVGDDTRIDYTPNAGAPISDSFAVRLVPGDAVLRVTVSPPKPAGK